MTGTEIKQTDAGEWPEKEIRLRSWCFSHAQDYKGLIFRSKEYIGSPEELLTETLRFAERIMDWVLTGRLRDEDFLSGHPQPEK